MTIEQMILEQLRSLPAEKQHEVFNFAKSLQKGKPGNSLKDPKGLWKGLCADITLEEITEARREMWGNFPREIAR